MAQSILITDVLVYSAEYVSYDTSSRLPFFDYGNKYQQNTNNLINGFVTKILNEVKSYGHEIDGQFHYHPRTGTLVLFMNVFRIVICGGIYDAEESMKRGKIVLVPGSFFPMSRVKFDYFDNYVDYNLIVNTGYETLYYINEFDVDGCSIASEFIRKGIHNSILYPAYERMRAKLMDIDPERIDFDKVKDMAIKYEEYNTWQVWEYNIVIAAIKSVYDICFLCGDSLVWSGDDDGYVRLVPLIIDLNDPKIDFSGIEDDDKEIVKLLTTHSMLCPYCYNKAIRQVLSEEELECLMMCTYIDGMQYFGDYYYDERKYIGKGTPKCISKLPMLEKEWGWRFVDDDWTDKDEPEENNIPSNYKEEEYITDNRMMQLIPEGVDPEKYYLPASERSHTDKTERNISNWESETILRRAGYTVEKKSALTAKARQSDLNPKKVTLFFH